MSCGAPEGQTRRCRGESRPTAAPRPGPFAAQPATRTGWDRLEACGWRGRLPGQGARHPLTVFGSGRGSAPAARRLGHQRGRTVLSGSRSAGQPLPPVHPDRDVGDPRERHRRVTHRVPLGEITESVSVADQVLPHGQPNLLGPSHGNWVLSPGGPRAARRGARGHSRPAASSFDTTRCPNPAVKATAITSHPDAPTP